jgi:hypothetical protein
MNLCKCLAVAAVAGFAAAGPVSGQSSRELAERHPAAQTVVRYLRTLLTRDFGKAGMMVAPDSLRGFKEDYLKRVKNPNVPLDDVLAMCRAVGAEDESGIEAMTPHAFYVAYNKGMQRRFNVTDEVNRRIADTLELHLLSVGEEPARAGDSLEMVHFLVRTRHDTMRNNVRNLEIVSLVRQDDKWLVSLGEHVTKIAPLEAPPAKSQNTPQRTPAKTPPPNSDAPANPPAATPGLPAPPK